MKSSNFLTPKTEPQNILFVSDLPPETQEQDIANFFSKYEFSSCKILRSKTNVFAYVTLKSLEFIEKAKSELNGELLIPIDSRTKKGKHIRICKYEQRSEVFDNKNNLEKNLLVRNIDKSITAKEFYKLMEEYGEIKSCKLDYDENGISKGSGCVSFSDEASAIRAKNELNGKVVKGLKIEVVNLIPSKSKDNQRNNLFVSNIPSDFDNNDLKNFFSKYGNITSSIIQVDDKGFSKGQGFVCFSTASDASRAIIEIKDKKFAFPGLPPLYLNFAMSKQERINYQMRENNKIENDDECKLIAKLAIDDPEIVMY